MAAKSLKVAADLALPIDAATQTFAFIARKGAGKTYTAGKLVELLLEAHVQVVVLDTVGNWYGLRLGADGKSAGFAVPVLGGLRGDIPLDPASGALIADTAVDTGQSMVLDVSQWSKADRQRFAAAFGERLWLKKKGEHHPTPLHLVIEESQLIVPQDVRGDTARMVGVYEEIIRLGRNYGIGVSMITQRPQSVNKEVLNQTECLFVGQINGAQERDALKKWVTHQGADVNLVDELPGLKVGTFYCWSPQWLGILQKVQVLAKRTFDGSATPKVGDRTVRRELKPLDLTELEQRMAATIEKAKADDPKALRAQLAAKDKRISELESDVKMQRASLHPAPGKPTPVLTDADRALVAKLNDMLLQVRERALSTPSTMDIEAAFARVVTRELQARDREQAKLRETFLELFEGAAVKRLLAKLELVSMTSVFLPAKTISKPEMARGLGVQSNFTPSRNHGTRELQGTDLDRAQLSILQTVSMLHQRGLSPTREMVARWLGIHPNGGRYNSNLAELRKCGLLDGLNLTPATEAYVPFGSMPTGPDAARAALADGSQQAIFDALDSRDRPDPIGLSREQLAERLGIHPNGGRFNSNLAWMRTMGLLPERGQISLTGATYV